MVPTPRTVVAPIVSTAAIGRGSRGGLVPLDLYAQMLPIGSVRPCRLPAESGNPWHLPARFQAALSLSPLERATRCPFPLNSDPAVELQAPCLLFSRIGTMSFRFGHHCLYLTNSDRCCLPPYNIKPPPMSTHPIQLPPHTTSRFIHFTAHFCWCHLHIHHPDSDKIGWPPLSLSSPLSSFVDATGLVCMGIERQVLLLGCDSGASSIWVKEWCSMRGEFHLAMDKWVFDARWISPCYGPICNKAGVWNTKQWWFSDDRSLAGGWWIFL